MAFCAYCGCEIPDDAEFCVNCGAPVYKGKSENKSKREQAYAGKLIKCPNCGEVLDSFVTVCPSCGYEIRESKSSSAVQDFALRISKAGTEREKIAIIRNFPIPNTKEDILEFSFLASTNINENLNLNDEVSDAWFAKLGQAYQKAQVSFKDQPECKRVRDLYDDVKKEMENAKKARKSSQLISILPNVIVVTGWLLILFIFTPFCQENPKNKGADASVQLLLMVILIFGAFFVPLVCRCTSVVPKMITTAGLILCIVLTIPLAIDDAGCQLMVLIDVICGAIIIGRMFSRDNTMQMDAFSAKTVGICIGICLIAYIIASIAFKVI